MSEQTTSQVAFHVCAGICRVNPKTNLCVGCGRPWDSPRLAEPEESLVPDTEPSSPIIAKSPDR